MTCATGKMVCATRQNDVRSWQNGVRAISDGTDVLGKMLCALMCALVCALMCAPVAGVPVAQRISFHHFHPCIKKVSGTLHLVQETWRPRRPKVPRKPKVPDTLFMQSNRRHTKYYSPSFGKVPALSHNGGFRRKGDRQSVR